MTTLPEIVKYVHAINDMGDVAVKIASDDTGCFLAQKTAAEASSSLYEEIQKEAGFGEGRDNVSAFRDWLDKTAGVCGKELSIDLREKLAAAVVVDESLAGDPKQAEVRALGREFIIHLLGKVL
jgi:hypothetical protein